jgi:EAL domain-containing protein (putative c-di-GMP-specific phosphodiesterase class I)
VETVAQRTALAALGATAAQGYLFYPAMAVEQATAVLQGLTQSANARAIPIVRAPAP